ncbi:MAG TPA: ABC transporter ATP-binding protein [Candidatus Obscuribacterales bacterium]
MSALLQIQNLTISYTLRGRKLLPVEDVSLDFAEGRITALIGESGCGKSTLTAGILGILAANSRTDPASRLLFRGRDLLRLAPEEQRRFRWQQASMVFQAAQNALSPTLRIEEQLIDTLLDHQAMSPGEAKARARERLGQVRLEADRVLKAYPHQLSGGMRQRVLIAMALLMEPELILLDEPTTALDVITQRYIFDILRDIHKQLGTTMILITHDLAAAAELADEVVVMYAGRIMEQSPAKTFFSQPLHPYSEGLLRALPSLTGDASQREPIAGHPPDLAAKPGGCVFHPRCPIAEAICKVKVPVLARSGESLAACHLRTEQPS